ncbi:hypothetical protein EW146_g2490 [Bondarzewia mesenterica]|uniref:Uncharacterized protein n=1 Tax=Bondarzewia mesenterica TaxID=1095465 RepID=A0A4V3XFQ8_9AGAM|nr:hypothetical protein EW146_g2490 [Bondarzewia mesenterica]
MILQLADLDDSVIPIEPSPETFIISTEQSNGNTAPVIIHISITIHRLQTTVASNLYRNTKLAVTSQSPFRHAMAPTSVQETAHTKSAVSEIIMPSNTNGHVHGLRPKRVAYVRLPPQEPRLPVYSESSFLPIGSDVRSHSARPPASRSATHTLTSGCASPAILSPVPVHTAGLPEWAVTATKRAKANRRKATQKEELTSSTETIRPSSNYNKRGTQSLKTSAFGTYSNPAQWIQPSMVSSIHMRNAARTVASPSPSTPSSNLLRPRHAVLGTLVASGVPRPPPSLSPCQRTFRPARQSPPLSASPGPTTHA